MISIRRTFVFTIVLVLAVCFAMPIAAGRNLDGAISGLVLDSAGKPVRGVEAQVWEGVNHGYFGVDWTPTAFSGFTGRNGAYKITVPPGTYRVWFKPADLTKNCMEAYPNDAIPDIGDDVVVRAGRTTARISVTLDGNCGWIAGRVYDAATNSSLSGIPVNLAIQQVAVIGTLFGTTYTDINGDYRFDGLKPWMWGVWVNPPWERERNQVYLDLIVLDEEWTADNPNPKVINADLEEVGFVSVRGKLVNQERIPAQGIEVTPYFLDWWDGQWYGDGDRTVQTNASGLFEMANLSAGIVVAGNDLVAMFWEAGNQTYGERYYNGADQSGEIFTVKRGQTICLGEGLGDDCDLTRGEWQVFSRP